jgi:hypothetical protein
MRRQDSAMHQPRAVDERENFKDASPGPNGSPRRNSLWVGALHSVERMVESSRPPKDIYAPSIKSSSADIPAHHRLGKQACEHVRAAGSAFLEGLQYIPFIVQLGDIFLIAQDFEND